MGDVVEETGPFRRLEDRLHVATVGVRADLVVIGGADDHGVGALTGCLARRLDGRSGRRQHHPGQDGHSASRRADHGSHDPLALSRGQPRALAAAAQDEEPARAP